MKKKDREARDSAMKCTDHESPPFWKLGRGFDVWVGLWVDGWVDGRLDGWVDGLVGTVRFRLWRRKNYARGSVVRAVQKRWLHDCSLLPLGVSV